jgi:hypothetical protein
VPDRDVVPEDGRRAVAVHVDDGAVLEVGPAADADDVHVTPDYG